MIFNNRYRTQDVGLLVVRVGLGVMFMVHGLPKLAGGPAAWTGVGSVYCRSPSARRSGTLLIGNATWLASCVSKPAGRNAGVRRTA